MILSVIVSAYSLERFHDLADVIDGISNQAYSPIETIIIIDENKELFNKVNEYIKVKNLENVHTIFNSENKGLSYSRNIGIKSSHGSIIAFIDDDAVPSIDWAKNIVETFNEDSLIGAVTGDVTPQWECSDMSWFPRELYWMLSCSYVMTPKEKKEFERGFGTNMAFKKNIFDKIGVFNTNLGINGKKWVGGEDSDMFLKVKKAGMKILFNPEICVRHKIYSYRIKTKNLAKRAFNGGYSVFLMKKLTNYSLYDSTEHQYMKHIIFKFFPLTVRNISSKNPLISIKQMFIVSVVLFSEFSGLVYGYFDSLITPIE